MPSFIMCDSWVFKFNSLVGDYFAFNLVLLKHVLRRSPESQVFFFQYEKNSSLCTISLCVLLFFLTGD